MPLTELQVRGSADLYAGVTCNSDRSEVAKAQETRGYLMAHIVYVDLSAKLEQWSCNSAIALSDGFSRVILAPSQVKQQARDLLIAQHGRKSVRYRLLAALIYLLVRDDLNSIRQIVIDQDYAGHQSEATIKNLLLHHLRRQTPDLDAGFVRFEEVRGSNADQLARRVYLRRQKADRVIRFEELAGILRK